MKKETKNMMAEAEKATEKFFCDEIRISKNEFLAAGIILLLAGVAIGLLLAPLTHGVNVSLISHNGSNNGNNSANNNNNTDEETAEKSEKNPLKRYKNRKFKAE
ncbi:MAG: hypothetical protein J1F41_10580 [Lachnospiraceae bacterium]|nr:hypothetical protein [Lachnospiraceae bacterium]